MQEQNNSMNSLAHTKWNCKYHIVLGVPKEEICVIIKSMKCERCKNENKQIKAGKTKAGSQKYKCKHCGKV